MGTAADIIDRLKEVYRAASDTDLASVLGVKKNTVSNWRARDSKPFTICELTADRLGVSLDWLVSGVGPMWRDARRDGDPPLPPCGPTSQSGVSGQNKRADALLAMLSSIDQDASDAIIGDAFARAAAAQQLADLRQAVAALTAKTGTG